MAEGDAIQLFSIICILVVVNFGLPAIASEFSGTSTSNSETSLHNTSNLDQLSENASNPVGFVSFAKSIAGIFLWSFGNLPVWLDLIFLLLRSYGYILIFRMIRGN